MSGLRRTETVPHAALTRRKTQDGGLRSLDDQHVRLGDQDCPHCCGSAGTVATVRSVAPLEIAVLCEEALQT